MYSVDYIAEVILSILQHWFSFRQLINYTDRSCLSALYIGILSEIFNNQFFVSTLLDV